MSDDCWVCKFCSKEVYDDQAKMMSCERCKSAYCCECLNMSFEMYDLMNNRPDIHWFCTDCDKQAMTAVKGDWEIEERCAKYLETMNQRFDQIESTLSTKADKAMHDSLATKVATLDTQMNGLCSDITSLDEKIALLRTEPEEINKRKNNLIIRGIPEDSDHSDVQLVREVFRSINVNVTPSESDVSRLGKKRDDDKGRPLRVDMKDENAKWKAIKDGPKLRTVDLDAVGVTGFDPRRCFLVPDLTLLQRREDAKLRESLKIKRQTDPNWKIKKGKLVRIQSEEKS